MEQAPKMTISLSRSQAQALRRALSALRSGYAAEWRATDSNEDICALRWALDAHDELLTQLRPPIEHHVTLVGDCRLIADAVWLHLLLSLETLSANVGGRPLALIDTPDALKRLAHIKQLITLAPAVAQQADDESEPAKTQGALAA